MGSAVDRLRDLVQLTIRVPSYVRHVDGKFIHVDAYTRKGQAAEKAPPKPKVAERQLPFPAFVPGEVMGNESLKSIVDKVRALVKNGYDQNKDNFSVWFADPKVRDVMKVQADLFDQVRKPGFKQEGLTKAGKIMAGREWGRYDTVVRTSRLLARMKSGSIGKPEATKEFWDLMDNRLVPKVMSNEFPIPSSSMRQALIARAKEFGIGTDAHVPEKPTGEEPPEVVPPITEVKSMPPGGLTPGKAKAFKSEVLDIHAGDEVWIDLQAATPADAWAIVVKHPDGTAHTISGAPNVSATVKETQDMTLEGLGVPGSGIKYKHYGTVAGIPEPKKVELPGLPGVLVTPPEPEKVLGGKIDVLTIDVPQQSGEGTKKVVVSPSDEMWKGYGGAVGVHHMDDTWTVYDLGPDKHVKPGDLGYEAWDKVGKGENPQWEQIEPEAVKASPPPKETEAPPLVAVKVPTESGKIVTLEPGEKVFQAPIGHVLIGTPDGKITLYMKQKQFTMLPGDEDYNAWNQTVKGMKPDSPYQPVEPEKPEPTPEPKPKAPPKPKAKKKPKTVVPTAALDADEIEVLKNPVVSYGWGDGVDQFMTTQRKRYLQVLTDIQHEMGPGASAPDYWITALGKQSTIDLLTEIVGKTETARTDEQFGLQPGQKAKLAKDRKRYEALLEAGLLARDLETLPEDELDARMTSVGEKLSSGVGYYAAGPYKKIFTKGSKAWNVPNWPYAQKAIFPALQQRTEKRLFDVRKASLGFDPEKADDATLASFIADKGAGDIAPWLSTEQKQDWIRVWLRDPSILDKYSPDYNATDKYADVLQKLTKAATISMSVDKVTKMANLDLHVHAVPEGPDVDQQKAIAQQLVDAQKRYELLKDLKRRYQIVYQPSTTQVETKALIRQNPDGSWEAWLPPTHEWHSVQESEVLDLLVSDEKWEEVPSSGKALTQHMIDEAEAQQLLGMPTGAATRKAQNTWLKDHGGSNVGRMTQPEREEWIAAHLAQNNLLKYAIEDAAGKKAKNPVPHPGQTTHPGSPDSPNGKAALQLFADQAAVSVWGTIYRDDKLVSLWMPEEVLTFATAMHLDYGFPPDTGGIPEGIARVRVQDFLNRLPGSKLPPPSPGLETVVPDEAPKGPLTKPEGVSDDVFSLFEALKVVTPDQHAVALFSKTANGFSNEQVDVYLKNSSIFGGSSALAMVGIYDAPLPVKQATVAAMKGLDEEAPFPEGFMDYVKAQVQAGVFDPPKPEGYYGAVSNGATVYYLQPGDKVMEAGEYQSVSKPVQQQEFASYKFQPGDQVFAADPKMYPAATAYLLVHADGSKEWLFLDGGRVPLTPSDTPEHLANWNTPVAPAQTTTAPPKDEVYNNPLKPGDTVYIPPGYTLGSTSVRVLHQDGSVDVVDPDGTHFLQSYTAQEWLVEHDWTLIMTGPTAVPKKVGHGPFQLAPDDIVYPAGTGVLYVRHTDGSWERIYSGEGAAAAAGAAASTQNMPNGFAASASGTAQVLESWVEKQHKVAIENPAEKFPDAFTLTPGAPVAPGKVTQPKSVLWVQHADGTGSWITADGVENVTDEQVSGLFDASHPYIPLKPTSLPPKPIGTYKQAQEMGLPPGVPPSLWEVGASADELPEDWSPPDLVATDEEIRTGLLTAKEAFGVEVSIAFVENAPPQVQRALYDHLASGAPPEVLAPLVGVMNWKAEHGHWGYKTYKPPFAAGKPYTPYILSGLTDNSSVSSWPYDALSQFQIDYKVNGAEAIAAKLDEVLNGKKPIVPMMSAANEPLKFSEDKDAHHPGGSHSGNRTIKDQHGNKYLYKVYQNDPKSPAMRVEQEVYSARISQLLGFHHPPVQDPVMVLGKYAYIQSMVNFKFDMQGVHPEDLDDNILTQVAEEHILDWTIANADTYYSNIAVSGDGKHVIGIDKGQAFKLFPNDELSPTYTAGNPIAPYYNEMYAAVVSHKISKERTDAMVRHLLIRAKRVAQAHDPEHRALLEKAFANRTDFKGMSKDEFIDALIERKHAAPESFEELWKGVYAKAGYSWDHPPLDELQFSKIETERGSAWSGISPEYFEAVEETKVHGRSAMFAGTDLEDGHLLFFEEHDTEGKRVLLGEGKLREAADGRLTAWLQAQKVADSSGTVVTQQTYVLPGNDAFYQKIVAAAMTVNHHADDGEYNQAHLDAMTLVKTQMEQARTAILQHQKVHPAEPFQGPVTNTLTLSFPDTDAQAAFLDMTSTYLDNIGEIETAKANQTKTPNKKYTQYVYTPKAKAKVDEEWKSQGFILQKTEDGVWHHIDESTGVDEVISEQQASDFITSGSYTQGSQGKAVTSLQVKVYKRKASRPEGVLDLDTGELKESGGEETTGSSGHEYDVEIGDHIVLEYRPWHGANQPLADQGFFRIRVKNWDNDEGDLDQAFQQLAAMGVDLTPADEESLELLYWRLWEGVAGTRAQTPVAVQTVVKNIKSWRTQNPNASDAEELEFLRSAWTPYLGADKVENVDFMPKFDHTRPQTPEEETGHPYWYRPDATLDDMIDPPNNRWHFGSQNVTYGGSENDKVPIGKSGGLDSSDERLRLYGHWLQKGSSLQDKPHGSTGQVFTRPQMHSGNDIAFVPDVFLRMQTYAASGDKWGDVGNKGNYAPFSVDGLKKASTEMMVKHTVSVLDSFIMMRMSDQRRTELIEWYHAHGIHTIRGIPVEERFVAASSLNSDMVAKLWEKELAWRAQQKQEAALAA